MTTRTRKGFTLVELMVVILIVGILAAAAIPMMQGKINSAKWAEANATAGSIRSAVRLQYAKTGTGITGSLGNTTTQDTLGFDAADLTGTYFDPSNYNIDSVDTDGIATITVTAGAKAGAKMTGDIKTLGSGDSWQ